MRKTSAAIITLLCLHGVDAQAASAISLLVQFDKLREEYPELIERNLQIVIDTTKNRTAAEEARAVQDDNEQNVMQMADALGPVLGPLFAEAFLDDIGLTSLRLPLTATALDIAYITVLDAVIAKEYFKNPRPFQVSDEVERAEGSSGGGYSYPSGHTTFGYTMMLSLAYLFPERYQEIVTRASEYGNNRIVVGVHYPMDVIGGRIISESNVAELLANPVTRLEFNLASAELHAYFERNCGATAAECARARSEDDIFANYEQNKADYTYRLTYGFTGTFDTDVPMDVPAGAEWLIASRFPYLDAEQRREVLRTTALPSGDAMLDIENWERLNLFAAADGYGAIESDTRVSMHGQSGGFELYDRWRNDITGNGILTKDGTGWLDLTGDNSFGGIVVEGGTIRLLGDNDFSGTSAVAGGTLIVDGRLATPFAVAVTEGGLLAGSGVIDSIVTIADGILAPGTDGPGTLTIGELHLGDESMVVFQLGEPGVIGGALNDYVAVDGALGLDGTFHIANADDYLAPGVYRLFTYGGALDDAGLDLGTFPGNATAAALTVDTSNAHQVNLVVGDADGELSFWNGGQTTPDGTVHGGTGIWTATTPNWTDLAGDITFAWNGMRAVFQGAAGTVSVAGGQSIEGLVFVTDGYRLTDGGDGALITMNTAEIQVNSGVIAYVDVPVMGPGGIDKTDGGTLVLSAVNGYQGGTRLSGGVLSVGADGNLGAAEGALHFDGGVLRITGTGFTETARSILWGDGGGGFDIADAANGFTVAQDLSGTGGLLKTGAGTLFLTGTNSIIGTIEVADGTLAGDSDSLNTDILDDAEVTFYQAADGIFAARIGGTGHVTKDGDGTLTVTGTMAQTGGTTIAGGTLQIGDGGTAGTLYNAVVNLGTLVFDRADDTTFSGSIAGTGMVVKRGAGTLNLTGDSTLTGDTLVEGGTLAVNGALPDSDVTLNPGTAITGIGRIGSLTALMNSVVAPGDEVGVGLIEINGDLSLMAGSRFEVEVDGDGDNDHLTVTGATTIGDGAELALAGMRPGERYTVISSAGGVSGRFMDLEDDFAFLDPTVTYDADSVTAALERNGTAFAERADSENGRQAAAAVEALGTGNALFDDILTATPDQAAAAFATLTGEIYPGAVAVLMQEARHVQNAIVGRLLRSLRGPGTAVATALPGAASGDTGGEGPRNRAFWTSAYGAFGTYEGEAGAGVDSTTTGFLIGADAETEGGWRLGIAGGIAQVSLDGDSILSSADLTNYGVALYGGKQFRRVGLRLGASYAYTSGDGERTVVLPAGNQHLTADYTASTYQVFADAGYDLRLRGRLAVEPFVGVSLGRVSGDEVEETGGSAALTADDMDATTSHSTVGVRFGSERERGDQAFGFDGAVGWRHAFGDTEPTADMSFNSDPAGGFSVSGTPLARDALALEAGVDYSVSQSLELGVRYNGQMASEADEHGLSINLRVKF
ncbi:autotransporter domain-containing protein [Zavarzinia compransoris]|uniref:autotransporter domain-containing protein n=1 Tax=Zavarzinia marina TaxID=2911065 RepID=UPI001F243F38|nr:autotransporter domain-containing protein [Zavarzinia marina]MCF4164765.1 autotransporter domain-containing protein [Zavarzinia marina]